jgi:hypothetical protein
MGDDFGGHEERFGPLPSEGLSSEGYFFDAQRFAVGFGGIDFVGATVADMSAADDERGALRFGLRGDDRFVEGGEVVHIAYVLDVPTVGFEPLAHIIGVGQVRIAIDRDVVVIVEADQFAETEMAGEGRGFV